MSELSVVNQTRKFLSRDRLLLDLSTLGVQKGMTVMVHSSMKRVGWIPGAESSMIAILKESVGAEGTLVMPAQTPANSDPRYWQNPPVPESWWQPIRDEMEPFHKQRSIPRGMGRIAEAFCADGETLRSDHPMHSVAAWGLKAEQLTANHPLEESFSMDSPLGVLYQLDAYVLLLGVGYNNATILHLCETLQPSRTFSDQGSAMIVDGKRQWVTYRQQDVDNDVFPALGMAFENEHTVAHGMVGQASARLVPIRPLVDFGIRWLKEASQ